MTGAELRKCRERLRLTQAELAAEVGVTKNAIALAERDERGIGEPLARLVRLLVKLRATRRTPNAARDTRRKRKGD